MIQLFLFICLLFCIYIAIITAPEGVKFFKKIVARIKDVNDDLKDMEDDEFS